MRARRQPKWLAIWRRLLILQAAILVVGWFSYRWAGHALIESMVADRRGPASPGGEGARHPLGSYLGAADAIVADVLVLGVVVVLVQLGAYLLARRARSRSTASRPERHERPTDPSLSRSKRLLFGLLAATVPLVFISVIYGVRYVQYRGGLEVPAGLEEGTYEPPPMPGLTQEQLLQVGYAHRGDRTPLRSYLNASPEKPAGAVRIGLFGDSYVEGEEAALEHDIASHLERLLHEAGAERVEVINFGVSGYGVSQSVRLWEYLGEEYGLDYVIVMPFWFHIERDTSFLFIDRHFGPLHGLHVLENGVTRYVPVLGEDRLDSCRRYFDVFQATRYWRYDTRVPMLFRPLFPSAHGQRGNPFYYRRDVDAAATATYRQLFREVAAATDQLVVITDDVLFPELRGLQCDSIHVVRSSIEDLLGSGSSIYRAPRSHPSGLGYELYAAELAALLLGEERPVYEMLRVGADLLPSPTIPEGVMSEGLLGASDVQLSIAGAPIAGLQRRERGEPRWWRLNEPVDFAGGEIASLAAHASEEGLVFLPLTFLLHENDEIALEWTMDGEVRRVPVGHIARASGVTGQVVLDWTRLENAVAAVELRMSKGDGFDVLEMACRARVESLRVLIGDRLALVGRTREPMSRFTPHALRRVLLGRPWTRTITEFRPVTSWLAYIRSRAGEFVALDRLEGERGALELTWRDGTGVERALPLLPYEIVETEGPRFEPSFGAPLSGR